jgi:hypothetical protein
VVSHNSANACLEVEDSRLRTPPSASVNEVIK